MDSSSSFIVYLVVNSLLVVYLLRLSEGEIKPLLTYLLKRCSCRKRKEMTNTTDVSDMKMTRLRQGVNLICE